MPFPHASDALSHFTVTDLTGVRSGPTCVRARELGRRSEQNRELIHN